MILTAQQVETLPTYPDGSTWVLWRARMLVQPDIEPPFEADVRQELRSGPRTPGSGMTVRVWYDPADRTNVLIDPRTVAEDPERKQVRKLWITSVGGIAAPLLAGFSFTAVITISAASGFFRWPGLAVLALTLASVSLIIAIQAAKRADVERLRASGPTVTGTMHRRVGRWYMFMRTTYHIGIVVLLLGLGLALFPKQGASQYALLWAASMVAFATCVLESVFIIVGCLREWSAMASTRGT